MPSTNPDHLKPLPPPRTSKAAEAEEKEEVSADTLLKTLVPPIDPPGEKERFIRRAATEDGEAVVGTDTVFEPISNQEAERRRQQDLGGYVLRHAASC